MKSLCLQHRNYWLLDTILSLVVLHVPSCTLLLFCFTTQVRPMFIIYLLFLNLLNAYEFILLSFRYYYLSLVYLLTRLLFLFCRLYIGDELVDLCLFFLARPLWHTMFSIMPNCYNLYLRLERIHYLYELAQRESDKTISLKLRDRHL